MDAPRDERDAERPLPPAPSVAPPAPPPPAWPPAPPPPPPAWPQGTPPARQPAPQAAADPYAPPPADAPYAPTYAPPGYGQPGQPPPANGQPGYGPPAPPPASGQPGYGPPAPPPASGQPGYGPPTYGQPAYGPPPYGPPGYWPVPPPAPRRRRFPLAWVTLVAAIAVIVADVAVIAERRGGTSTPISVAVEERLVTESSRNAERRAGRRDAAIDAMFARRATAVRQRDRAAFLADIDPEQRDFAARQGQVFDSLRKLDFAHWSYEANGESYSPGSIDYERYGRIGDLWLPVVILRYQLKGFDAEPVGRRVVYTVVQRGSRWYIGGDTDLDATTSSGTSVRVDPWENGPILVQKGAHGIVIGHPEDAAAIGAIRREVEDAVRHVRSYVGDKHWNRKVVVVLPTDDEELDRILENPTTFFDFAAVARPLGTIPRAGESREFAGSRVVINPEGFDAKSDFTTHLIRHEITHVAMFERVGPLTPKWLIEGVAEYVGNAQSPLPPEVLAAELTQLVAKGGVPTTLPTDSDFGLINDAGVAYNSAWLLCRYIASRYGRARLFEFHDAMGTTTGLDRPSEKFPKVLRATLGTSEEQLLAGWRRYVRASVADLTKLLVKPGGGYQQADSGRLAVKDIARQKGLDAKALERAGFDRAAAAFWYDGPESRPSRRFITTLVVTATQDGAATVERLLADRLRPFDAGGRAIPNGRMYYVGTSIGGRHYNETIAILRAGTVVMEVRVAIPGAADSGGETRGHAARQHAAVA